jgi:hypothetical protein
MIKRWKRRIHQKPELPEFLRKRDDCSGPKTRVEDKKNSKNIKTRGVICLRSVDCFSFSPAAGSEIALPLPRQTTRNSKRTGIVNIDFLFIVLRYQTIECFYLRFFCSLTLNKTEILYYTMTKKIL